MLALVPALFVAMFATSIPCVASTHSATSTMTLVSENGSYSAQDDEIVDDEVLMVAEKMPEFPGGQAAMFQFVSQNLHYPEYAVKHRIQGCAICQFIVERDGSIGPVEIVRSSGHDLLDAEAAHIIKSMPKWKPGEDKGKPVRVKFTIPINFRLK